MSNCVLFPIKGSEALAASLRTLLGAEKGRAIIKHLPNGETSVKVETNMLGKQAIIVCSLHHADEKQLPLYFLAKVLKELSASNVMLVAPYLPYIHYNGDSMNAVLFTELLSRFVDILITVDAKQCASLHSRCRLHTAELFAAPLLTAWVVQNVKKPLFIVTCSREEQVVSDMAVKANASLLKLEKFNKGNRLTKASLTEAGSYKLHTPVIFEEILSANNTMAQTIRQLVDAGMKPPVCVGIHAVMYAKAHEKMLQAGAAKVVTCNTIPHPSNNIYIDELLAKEIRKNIFVV